MCYYDLGRGVCGALEDLLLTLYSSLRHLRVPLFCVPQTSHVRSALRPVLDSSRLPQSVQKTRDPMAAILRRVKEDCLFLYLHVVVFKQRARMSEWANISFACEICWSLVGSEQKVRDAFGSRWAREGSTREGRRGG
jgi:hypothetical protein